MTAVYLYGSYAAGRQKADSDIDLAVLFTKQATDRLRLRFKFEEGLGSFFKKKVQIQDLQSVGIEFTKKALDEGILVLDKHSSARVAFEVKAMQQYFDLLPFYNEYYAVLQKQSLKGNFHD